MKVISTLSRYLLGLVFVVFGLNGFLSFIPPQPFPPLATQFVGSLSVSVSQALPQDVHPASHVATHEDITQLQDCVCAPPPLQTRPHVPQLPTSLVVSEHDASGALSVPASGRGPTAGPDATQISSTQNGVSGRSILQS